MRRGVSLGTLALLLGGPLLTNVLYLCFSFWMSLQLARRGFSPRSVALLPIVFGIGYVLSCHVSARWVTAARAGLVLYVSAAALPVIGALTLLTDHFGAFLLLAAAMGVNNGHYFPTFQVAMGNIRPFRTLAWTIGVYNISWSGGAVLGLFLSGRVAGQSLPTVFSLITLLLLTHWALLWWGRPRQEFGPGGGGGAGVSGGVAGDVSIAVASTEGMRLASRMAVCLLVAVMAGVGLTLWPILGAQRQYSDRQVALGAALINLPLPLCSLLWAALRRWLRWPWMMVGLLLLLAVAIGLLPFSHWPWSTAVCLLALGFSGSGLFFAGVYYGNADPENPSKSVARFESAVGTGSIVGTLLIGLLAWKDAQSLRPYLTCAVLAAAAALITPRLFGAPGPAQAQPAPAPSPEPASAAVAPEVSGPG